MSVIEVDRLTKDYGFGRGVFDISFKVEQGEVFGFLGPNGAGKSTTIRHLMGFSRPQSGETRIFGKDAFDLYYEILRNVGYIPGEIALPSGLTGWEFIHMMQELQHNRNETRLRQMTDMFELSDTALRGDTKHMSLGVKRKLAVVTAFMGDPDVLILDEPTSGLDPVMQSRFINLVSDEKAKGKTVLLSSHIFSEVDATCDRIAIIKNGKIVSQFIADDLKHATEKIYKITFADVDELHRFINKTDVNFYKITKYDEDNFSATIETSDDAIDDVVKVLACFDIKEFTHKKQTLEDYFMQFYKEDRKFAGVDE